MFAFALLAAFSSTPTPFLTDCQFLPNITFLGGYACSVTVDTIPNYHHPVLSESRQFTQKDQTSTFSLPTRSTMYLSQPRDLISSMSTGCSRSTTLLPHRDNLAMLPNLKADPSSLRRQATKASASSRSLSTDHDYARIHDASPSTSFPGSMQPDPGHRNSLDYSTKTDSLSVVVSSSESRSMSRWFRSQHFQTVWHNLDPGNSETRPPHPYTELIKLCILKQRQGKLTLNQLYRDLEEKFPFFAESAKGKGWKVSESPSTMHLTK